MLSLPPISEESLQCLSLAALFEGRFSLDWIVELSGYRPSRVLVVLERKTHKGWIEKLQDGFFIFKDEKIKEALQENLIQLEKNDLHLKIAKLLIRELPDCNESQEIISQHLFKTPLDLDHCRLLLKAADKARQNRFFKKALSCYKKILDDIYRLSGMESDLLYIETTLKFVRIAMARENCTMVSNVVEKAVVKADKHDMKKDLFLLKMHLAKNDFLQARFSQSKVHTEEAWSIIKEMDIDQRFMLSVTAFRIFSYFWQGKIIEAIHTYEEAGNPIEQFPMEDHSILAAATVGYCYALSGQVSQGLGMLHAIQKHCVAKGDLILAGDIEVTIAGMMLQLHRPDEAIAHLENYKPDDCDNDWNSMRAKVILFLSYFLKGKNKIAVKHFKNWLGRVFEIDVTLSVNVYWLEFCKCIEEGKIPRFGNISLEDEVRKFEDCGNVQVKGTAWRYRAYLQERESQSHERILESLRISAKYLQESGDVFQLCRTYLELSRIYTLMGNMEASQELMEKISEMLGNSNPDFIPRDLLWCVKKIPWSWESLCDELLKLGQDISTTRDKKQLLQIILSTSNRITGAERGAIFKIEKNDKMQLTASKNITPTDINHQSFKHVSEMLDQVAKTRKGTITKVEDSSKHKGQEHILAQIAVPMIVRNRIVGVLYHDNTHYMNSFNEPDLKLLSGFATQAAIAIDHAEAYEEIQRLNQKLSQEKQYYREQSFKNPEFDEIIGANIGILEVLNTINRVAETDTTVLILGETGVGKDLVARAIHRHSKRNSHPFIKVPCNALPDTLMSSELFGHERGAFTGSIQRRIGRFELADSGTIFLDEIGELHLDVQTQLLQVLQSKEFERVGGSETIKSDFRLIAATNCNLTEAVKKQKFRSDLFYRLNVFPIHVPPLRERKDDIPALSYYFLKKFSARMGKKFDGISQGDMEKLKKYDWPGNIRELESIIQRATVLSQNNNFRISELSNDVLETDRSRPTLTLEENERMHILQTLKRTGWRVRGKGGAAELLNMHYSTLFFRMKKLGIQRSAEIITRRMPKKEINTAQSF